VTAMHDTPSDWMWAYHATSRVHLASIMRDGLRATWHEHAEEDVLFVEPSLEGVLPYSEGHSNIVTLRFKTPGFSSTDDGEDVLFSDGDPFVGTGEDARIPPQRLQILDGKKFRWLTDGTMDNTDNRECIIAQRLARGESL